ncbi:uncharacterized protein LOC143038926 [Oratosquilla oratoria]|uniref:uncharacterized protein LOC143038926 n=1 Tax=Oratosquilla oratoria TaxID=337810 RepID=UPI003F76FD77
MMTSRVRQVICFFYKGAAAEISKNSHGSNRKHQQLEEDCNTSKLQDCINMLQDINEDHDLAFASTEPELNRMCDTVEKGLNCVHNHVSHCFDKDRQRIINTLLTGTDDVIKNLCTPGKFRDNYRIYAPCMKNVSMDNNMCGAEYKRLIHSVGTDKATYEETVRQQCCAFHTYLDCVTATAEKECGKNAAHFIEDYSFRTASTIIQTRCRVYTPGSMECSYDKATQLPPTTYRLILFLLLLPALVHFFLMSP